MKKLLLSKKIIITFYILFILFITIGLTLFLYSYLNINNMFITDIEEALDKANIAKQVNEVIYESQLVDNLNTSNIDLIDAFIHMQISGLVFTSLSVLFIVMYSITWLFFLIKKDKAFVDIHKAIFTSFKSKIIKLNKKLKRTLKKVKKILRKIK